MQYAFFLDFKGKIWYNKKWHKVIAYGLEFIKEGEKGEKTKKKLATIILIAVCIIISVTRCGIGEVAFTSKKIPHSEKEIMDEIKASPSLGTYDSERYDVMYLLGIDGEVVILEKDGSYILADNPEKGSNFYIEVEIKNANLKPIGASSKYLFFEDRVGSKHAVKRITEKEEINVGRGELMGMDISIPYSELSEKEKDYIFIAYATEDIPHAASN